MEHQVDTTSFAMWLFLVTEIMFFGGLFCSYLIFRNWYYPAFVAASHQLSIKEGTANTAVLITNTCLISAITSKPTRSRAMPLTSPCGSSC